MLSWARRRLTYVNIAMTVALVLAMGGGAWAAKRYVINSTSQINPAVLKKLMGKAGPAGERGPMGERGPQGLAGEKGANGTNGKEGANGVNGDSVTNTSVSLSSAHCEKLGGAEFKVGAGEPTFACGGKAGANGVNGKSVKVEQATSQECKKGGTRFEVEGTGHVEVVCNGEGIEAAGTETGTWGWATEGEFKVGLAEISFTIPLTVAPTAFYVAAEEQKNKTAPSQCPGSAESPTAEPGNLCVYESSFHLGGELSAVEVFVPSKGPALFGGQAGASTVGAGLFTFCPAECIRQGTWAVKS